MFNTVFTSVYGTSDSIVSSISTGNFLICCLASILLGVVCAFVYMFRHTYSKNFVVTLALLPLIVQMVITLVNGNLGAGIAVMGVFNLVRFRSIPGSAKDIGSVFLAMAVGLATGMGFLALAVVFTVIVAIVNLIFVLTPLGQPASTPKQLKISVPEDLNFEGAFEPVLEKYCTSFQLAEVQTTNMGSLFQLTYQVNMQPDASTKQFIDDLRCLNGNLKVQLATIVKSKETL